MFAIAPGWGSGNGVEEWKAQILDSRSRFTSEGNYERVWE